MSRPQSTTFHSLFLLLTLALFSSAASCAAAPAVKSSGCGKTPPIVGGSKSQTLSSGREYIIHIPASYSADKAVPMVLSFHGATKDAENQQKLSHFGDSSLKWPGSGDRGISVYPQGVDNHWQGAPYSTPGVSDKNFINDLLDHLTSTLCIDTSRIYAAGKSNGGGFVNVLACSPTIASRFAAFAPVSGAYYVGNAADGSDCHPAKQVTPMLSFHGLSDGQIPYNGDKERGLPVILEWAQHWADRNGCTTKYELTEEKDGKVLHYTWPCNGGALQHYAIKGLKHSWPSTEPNVDSQTPSVVDATAVIMEFFGKHHL